MPESLARSGPYHLCVAMAAVCTAPELASILLAGGIHVVLCDPDGAMAAGVVVSLRSAPTARIAALVGNLAEPEVEAAALAMAHELFGGEPVVVRTESDACRLLTGASHPDRAGSGTFEPPFDSWSNPTP